MLNSCNCTKPPKGWYCPRPYMHEGPCATRPTLFTRLKWLVGFTVVLVICTTQGTAQTAKYRMHGPGVLNDLKATPGAVSTRTAAQLCAKTFRTGPIRLVTEATKHAACAEYGIDKAGCVGAKLEIDHLISLELGGTNDLTNLWPEPYLPKPGAREKDQVEDTLHRQVCSGTVSLATAQHEISTDWYAVYLTIQSGSAKK